MKRSLVLCLTVIGMMSALVSCKKNGPENVAALVNQDYIPAGLVISYKADVDKASVNPASYSVKGREIGSVFVSKSNPFSKETAADGCACHGGLCFVRMFYMGQLQTDIHH